MSTKKIAYLSLLTALALIIFFVEAQIPPIVPIPGIKLGLANVITLITLVRFGRRDAFAVLALRIALSSILTGTAAGFIYSASGGILSFLTIAVLIDVLKKDRLWAVSIFGA
ncbi:MAG: Gx transporter family protein, partial [Clostridia bacterium]|nr:Gx transporter family protein [Clostridia bacterium]